MKKIALLVTAVLTAFSLVSCGRTAKSVSHYSHAKVELVAKRKQQKKAAEKAKARKKKVEAAKKAKLARQSQAKLAAQQSATKPQAQKTQQNQQRQQNQQYTGQSQQAQKNQQPTEQQMINDPAKYSEQYRHSMASAEYRKWYYTPHYFDPDGNPITAQQHQELENEGAYNN